MKRCELKKLEKITFDEEIPLLDELYVVVSNKKHESLTQLQNKLNNNMNYLFGSLRQC